MDEPFHGRGARTEYEGAIKFKTVTFQIVLQRGEVNQGVAESGLYTDQGFCRGTIGSGKNKRRIDDERDFRLPDDFRRCFSEIARRLRGKVNYIMPSQTNEISIAVECAVNVEQTDRTTRLIKDILSRVI